MRKIIFSTALFLLPMFFPVLTSAQPLENPPKTVPYNEKSLLELSQKQRKQNLKSHKAKIKALSETLSFAKKEQTKQIKLNSTIGDPSEDSLNRFIILASDLSEISSKNLEKKCPSIELRLEQDKLPTWDFNEAKEWWKLLCE